MGECKITFYDSETGNPIHISFYAVDAVEQCVTDHRKTWVYYASRSILVLSHVDEVLTRLGWDDDLRS